MGILPFCEQKNLYDLIDAIDKAGGANARYDTASANNNTIGGVTRDQKIPWMLCPSSQEKAWPNSLLATRLRNCMEPFSIG